MKKTTLFTFGIIGTLTLTGCQSGSSDVEAEALREQVTQLEQQIHDLQDQISSGSQPANENTAPPSQVSEPEDTAAGDALPSSDPETENQVPSDSGTSELSTTRTMEELTNIVSGYEEKVNTVVSASTPAEDMELFFALKQEEKQIDDILDLHEDELEYLYRKNSLSRDEYRTLEYELERLEDRLDDAEDQLEYIFGIDD